MAGCELQHRLISEKLADVFQASAAAALRLQRDKHVFARGEKVCNADAALEWRARLGESDSGVAAGVPPPHVRGYDGAGGAQGGRGHEEGGVRGGDAFDEFDGAEGMGECGVFFCIGFLAAVVHDGGGNGGGVVGIFRGDALPLEHVAGEVYDGAGVPDEAAGAEGDGGVMFPRGACRHGPETIRACLHDETGEFAEPLVGDGVDFGV